MGKFADGARGVGCLVIIVLAVVFGVISVIVHFTGQPQKLPETRYTVVTGSRVYYSDQVVKRGKTYWLYGFWDTQRGRWKYHKEALPLGPEFDPVKVVPEVK